MTETEKRRMVLNAFDCFGPTHYDGGQWRRPGAPQLDYAKPEYWKNLGQVAERGMFDAVFIIDLIGLYDTYENSAKAAVESGMAGYLDPMIAATAVAMSTEHIGIGVTASTTYSNPFFLARTLNSLDWISGGRAGWNIVTSFSDGGAADLGIDPKLFQHDRRYEICEEFMDVAYKLWEGSWEEGAVVRDPESGIFADPTKVHPIDHKGEYFEVRGLMQAEPSPQRTPFLYQAGTSNSGRTFAAEHAEGIFILANTPEEAKEITSDIRRRMVEAGRDPYSAKIILLAISIAAETDEEAAALVAEYREYAEWRTGLVMMSTPLGTDMSQFDPDLPIGDLDGVSLVGARDFVQSVARDDPSLTLKDIGRQIAFFGWGPLFQGSPTTIADEMERWMDVGDIDGFNLGRLVEPEMREAFVDLVVPELQARGRVWTEYPKGTLREKSFGAGAHLPEEHVAAQYRTAFAGKRSAADPRPSAG